MVRYISKGIITFFCRVVVLMYPVEYLKSLKSLQHISDSISPVLCDTGYILPSGKLSANRRRKIFRSVFAGDSPAKTLRNHTFFAVRFLGVFSPRFRSDIAASFRSAFLGVHFRGDFAASYHTLFAVRL